MGHVGDVNARTPALDRLAAEGVSYGAAVTPHPFGPFARAALLTGVPCPANGVRDYYDPLPDDARTIAHELAARGYATAWFGKWHLARRDPAAPLVGETHARMVVPPESRGGFAFWEGFEGGFLLNDPWLHGTRLPDPVCVPGYQSDILCRRAEAWQSEPARTDRPWFSVVSLEAPHPPYDAPTPEPDSSCDPREIVLDPNVPRGGEVEARARRELAGYYAHVAATDAAIGRLLAAVRARVSAGGRATSVVFFSVHGDMHGAHGRFRKGWPHDESVRVPLITARWPGADGPRIDHRPVSLIDLPAQAMAWAENRVWEPNGAPAEISMPSIVHLPHQCDRVWSGWRGEGWKVVNEAPGGRPWLVFDLEQDPWEMENLAGDPRGASIVARAPRAQA
ncbi:MAG: sulfatase-like hydrolase/transferase [Opitutaceae bacterium]|nr:sulfatase-like hydrolase/transferase [Opitutaceae bacterium]